MKTNTLYNSDKGSIKIILIVLVVAITIYGAYTLGVENLLPTNTNGDLSTTLAEDKTKDRIAFISDRTGRHDIFVMNSTGSEVVNITNSQRDDYWPTWSPNNKMIAYHSYADVTAPDANASIFILDLDNPTKKTQLTDETGSDKFADISPSGKEILYASDRDGDYEIYVMDVDGSNSRQLTDSPAKDYFPMWSPDGSKIVFSSDRDSNDEIYVMDSDGSTVVRLTHNETTETNPAFSPDGASIAYTSNAPTGTKHVWIMESTGMNQRKLSSIQGGEPRWSSNGDTIAFFSQVTEDQEIFVMNEDGTGLMQLTYSPSSKDWDPMFSN